jgi:hypothetical protein
MTGSGTVQCPNCGTVMDDRARFCPGCGTPRSFLREQLEREAAATGVPYEQLLERERSTPTVAPPGQQAGWNVPTPPAAESTSSRRTLWIVLGIIGGVFLLSCAGCVVTAAVLIDRFDVDLGDSPEGTAASRQLELAARGQHQERWELLHPGQQAAVPVGMFAICAQYEDANSIDILLSFASNDSLVAGVGVVDTRVVLYSLDEGIRTETEFVEMVQVDGEWRWTMSEDDLRDYELGICPS